ncbi:hypothetical protein CEXT_650691 [Caerostris extrusa]|uniref:Uncharacterized protein n=1 Tax=Caerostris extrusa TaxID=172846 RepID=A0AAV4WCN2_CAEEX|nr:hypothetical protein CEXT_650691 [Caerostris extrusa]
MLFRASPSNSQNGIGITGVTKFSVNKNDNGYFKSFGRRNFMFLWTRLSADDVMEEGISRCGEEELSRQINVNTEDPHLGKPHQRLVTAFCRQSNLFC